MLFSNPDKQQLIESFQEPTLPCPSESFLDPPPLTATSVVVMKEMYRMTSEELLFSIEEDLLLKTFYLFPMTHDDAYSELPYNPQNLAILTLYLIEKKTNMNAILLSTCIQKGLLSNTIYLITRKETAQLGIYILEKFYFHLSSAHKSLEGKYVNYQGNEGSWKEEIGKDKGRTFKLTGFTLYIAILDRVKHYYYNNQFDSISHYSSFLIRYLALLLYKNQLEASQFLKNSNSTTLVMTSELNYLRSAYFEENTMASFLLGLARLERLKEKEFTHGPLLYSHILLDLLSTSPSALNSPFDWKLQFLVDFYGTY